jgi:hypothetical protein
MKKLTIVTALLICCLNGCTTSGTADKSDAVLTSLLISGNAFEAILVGGVTVFNELCLEEAHKCAESNSNGECLGHMQCSEARDKFVSILSLAIDGVKLGLVLKNNGEDDKAAAALSQVKGLIEEAKILLANFDLLGNFNNYFNSAFETLGIMTKKGK